MDTRLRVYLGRYLGKREKDDFHGCTCPGVAKKLNPSPRALAKTGLRTGSGSSGLSIPCSVRSTKYVRTMYVTLEYPCTAGRWGYLLEWCAQYFALRARTGADHVTYWILFPRNQMWIMSKFNFISRRDSCHHRHVDHLRYMYIGRFQDFA